jgi:hypothetical protein
MGKGKYFEEKIYFKLNYVNEQLANGTVNTILTEPSTNSSIITTIETGKNFLVEIPNTNVTIFNYVTSRRFGLSVGLGGPVLSNLEYRFNEPETNSFVSFIASYNYLEGTYRPDYTLKFTITGAKGRFEGATGAIIVHSTALADSALFYNAVTISGFRKKHHKHSGKHHKKNSDCGCKKHDSDKK